MCVYITHAKCATSHTADLSCTDAGLLTTFNSCICFVGDMLGMEISAAKESRLGLETVSMVGMGSGYMLMYNFAAPSRGVYIFFLFSLRE